MMNNIFRKADKKDDTQPQTHSGTTSTPGQESGQKKITTPPVNKNKRRNFLLLILTVAIILASFYFRNNVSFISLYYNWVPSKIIHFFSISNQLRSISHNFNFIKNRLLPREQEEINFEHLTVTFPKGPRYPDLKINISAHPYTFIPRKLEGLSLVYNIKAIQDYGEEYYQFDHPFVITINYKGEYLEQVKGDTIAVYRAGDKSENWTKLSTKLDTENKIATAESSLTGRFTLMGDINYTPQPLGYHKKEFPISEWHEYNSPKYSTSLKYPPNWQLVNTKWYEENEVVSLFAVGDIQGARQSETEIFDGAMIRVYFSPTSFENIGDWAEDFYGNIVRNITQERVGGLYLDKIETCGDYEYTCSTHYAFMKRGGVYRIITYSAGPDKEYFEKIIFNILSTFKIL